MGLYGMMRTGVSGMAAQSNRLSTVADNIANSSTNGYKRAQAEFSSLVLPSSGGSYNSGGVTTSIRYAISQSGPLQYTTSGTDLAVDGNGFFVVQDTNGKSVLTRAGSFIPNAKGELVNAAGHKLMGYDYKDGVPTPTVNSDAGLKVISIAGDELVATPSRNGKLTANLASASTPVAAGDLPSTNSPTASYTHKTSLAVYDNLGDKKLLDIYMTKTGPDTWEVAVYDRADAAPNTSFPYANPALATQTLTFDPSNGQLAGASATDIAIPVPGGDTLDLDMSGMTQLAAGFSVSGEADGAAPYSIDSVEIASDGNVFAKYADGSMRAIYRIPIATVQSPDQLQVLNGNSYTQSADSGDILYGFSGDKGAGKVVSGALESSNVDIAQELTDMIESQRNYTANSKVFQTGSDLMELLVNLKR